MADAQPDILAIFTEAVACETPQQREEFLADACGDDSVARQRVETLLRAHLDAGNFLGGDAKEFGATIDQPITEKPGVQIGPYKLLQQLGEGGMGVVYMAEQKEPVKRRVALKIIKPGMDTRQVIARFEAERQALAMMDHPNIAKVLDAGATESGRPYFVMELVKGVPVTQYCDEQHLNPKERLELFIPICQAVQHAHQKGIIHRDIKPSNILIALFDGQPVPKVIDFGVAKATSQTLTEKTMFTQLGQVVGTLEYMSPEQAQVNQLDIDTRSDIYSLGVVLYELLTGETPFDRTRLRSAAFDEMLRIIREEEPSKPSTKVSSSETLASTAANRRIDAHKLGTTIRGELDWIVMKALEKDRARRYETASKFAEDVLHYLNDEAVVACPPSAGYRFRKFARRHKTALTVSSIVALAVLLAVGSIGWVVRDRVARKHEQARQEAARQEQVIGQVAAILEQADRLARQQKWLDALAVAERAEPLIVSGEADTITQDKVRRTVADLKLVKRLEEARLLKGSWTHDGFHYRDADRAYAATFREFGVDVDALSPADAGRLLRSCSNIAVPVAVALDEWAHTRRRLPDSQNSNWRRLVDVARLVDPDPLRNRLREVWSSWSEPTPESNQVLVEMADESKVHNQPPVTVVLLERLLSTAELHGEAVALLRIAQHRHPSDFWINLRLAFALERQDRQDPDAVRFYSVAVGLRPGNTAALNDLGNALKRLNRIDEAITCYRKALEIDPTHVFAHSNLAESFRKQGRLDEAIKATRRAIELDPNEFLSHCTLGLALIQQGKLDEAISCFERGIELNPNSLQGYYGLGIAMTRKRELDRATSLLRKAIEIAIGLGGDHGPSRYYLGVALFEQDQVDEAIAEYRKSIELDSYYVNAHNMLGVALKRTGDQTQRDACT